MSNPQYVRCHLCPSLLWKCLDIADALYASLVHHHNHGNGHECYITNIEPEPEPCDACGSCSHTNDSALGIECARSATENRLTRSET